MLPVAVAVATTAMASGVGGATAGGHLVQFVRHGGQVIETVLSIVICTVPGVIVGAQLGSLVASEVSQHALERSLYMRFIIVALLTPRRGGVVIWPVGGRGG